MFIEIHSLRSIEQFTSPMPWVLITIAGSCPVGEKDYAQLPEDPNRKAVLQLRFDDVSIAMKGTNPFRRFQAHEIEKFLEKEVDGHNLSTNNMKEWIELICVNCYAGISRSSGIAAFLEYHFNGPDAEKKVFNDRRYFPNALVYQTLMTHFGHSFDPDKSSL